MSKPNSNPKKLVPSQGFISLLEDFHEQHPFKEEGNPIAQWSQKETETANGSQTAASEDLPFVPANIFKTAKQRTNRVMEDIPKALSKQIGLSEKAFDSLLEEFHDEACGEDREYQEDRRRDEEKGHALPLLEEGLKGTSEQVEEMLNDAEQKAARIVEDTEKAAEKRAQQLIKGAEKKTAQMIEEAKIKVQQIHQTAKGSGYNQGITEGHQSAYEETSEQLSSLAQTLTNLIAETAGTKELIIKEMEEEVLGLTLTIASKLAGVEISINQQAIVEIVKQGLQLLKDKKHIAIKVSEDEFESLKTHQAELLDFADGIENISIEKETALTAGDCFLYADSTLVDNTFKQRVEDATTAIWQSYHEKN